jgi:hypothetical protein
VDGGGPWTVTTPYNLDANGLPEQRTAERVWTRYTNQDTRVDPTLPDVGLILFDAGEAFHLAEYPTLAKQSVPQGSFVNCIGRKDRGELHSNALFLSESVAVRPSKRFPMSYRSQAVIEQGDSGGPALLEGTHEIIAVNSGVMDQHAAALFSAGDSSITGRDPVRLQVLARVDLVLAEILANIAQNGGFAEVDE